jgi:hypothetical protein
LAARVFLSAGFSPVPLEVMLTARVVCQPATSTCVLKGMPACAILPMAPVSISLPTPPTLVVAQFSRASAMQPLNATLWSLPSPDGSDPATCPSRLQPWDLASACTNCTCVHTNASDLLVSASPASTGAVHVAFACTLPGGTVAVDRIAVAPLPPAAPACDQQDGAVVALQPLAPTVVAPLQQCQREVEGIRLGAPSSLRVTPTSVLVGVVAPRDALGTAAVTPEGAVANAAAVHVLQLVPRPALGSSNWSTCSVVWSQDIGGSAGGAQATTDAATAVGITNHGVVVVQPWAQQVELSTLCRPGHVLVDAPWGGFACRPCSTTDTGVVGSRGGRSRSCLSCARSSCVAPGTPLPVQHVLANAVHGDMWSPKLEVVSTLGATPSEVALNVVFVKDTTQPQPPTCSDILSSQVRVGEKQALGDGYCVVLCGD